jgi:hypothetical protein
VFAVRERQEVNAEEMKKSLDTLRPEALLKKRDQSFSSYIDEVRKRMRERGEIQINEAVLEKLAQ